MLKKILSWFQAWVGQSPLPKSAANDRHYPVYVEYPNEITIPLPGITADTLMYIFPLQADYDRLLQVCNQRLNAVIKDQSVQFYPLTHQVLGVMSHIRKGYKAEKDYPKPGLGSEKAFQLFMPVAECTKNQAGQWVAQRIMLFVPYILVDNPFNVVTGREEVGFPKSSAIVTIPEDPKQAEHLQVDAFGFKIFDAEHPKYSEYQTWLTIDRIEAGQSSSASPSWSTHSEAWEAVQHTFERIPHPEFRVHLPFLIQELKDLLARRVDMVFLKQFRDSADPSKACYQAIIESPGTVNKFHQGWWLPGKYEVVFDDLASFPIKKELGLADRIEVNTAFWCNIDMGFPCGREIYRAS